MFLLEFSLTETKKRINGESRKSEAHNFRKSYALKNYLDACIGTSNKEVNLLELSNILLNCK